jgi:hypothetical protein
VSDPLDMRFAWNDAILRNRIAPFCLLAGLFVATAVAADAPSDRGTGAPFEIQLERRADAATTVVESGRAIVVVTSETGIGRMTLTPKEKRWPRDVTLRLRYGSGKPFTTLEGFELTASRMQVRSSSKQSGRVPFFLADDDGKFSRDDLNPSGWLKLEFKSHGDDLDVIFPSHLWRDEREIHIQWIDLHR